jgi:chemotaxis protein methyltransferase CheR
MNDPDLIAFLQWALPRLGLRWQGYRNVRARVRKKLNERLGELGLPDVAAYREYLEAHPQEWGILDALCRITISRFHRDRCIFDDLRKVVLPELTRRASERGADVVRCWSAGCASGEEPYTLRILWELGLPAELARPPLRVVATDIDARLLERAWEGRCRRAASRSCRATCSWRRSSRTASNSTSGTSSGRGSTSSGRTSGRRCQRGRLTWSSVAT